ncbi:hypothetical protein E2C01_038738 [Portunus trituberculatus]|uniref:Uncharacterized protein n=1 Tax=Portunus trituberculatus TaxID=210409 RepID=A0A5B7FKV9_PORTR|nr:hypothetical protein [Portunus trituberculatus]
MTAINESNNCPHKECLRAPTTTLHIKQQQQHVLTPGTWYTLLHMMVSRPGLHRHCGDSLATFVRKMISV